MKTSDFWKLAAILVVLMSALPFTAYGADGQQSPPAKKASSAKAAKPTSTASKGTPCPTTPTCAGTECDNYPFKPTECWPTKYGPAKADVVTSPTNLLYCNGNPYALCFFSGPPKGTGTNPGNNPLPCVLKGSITSCTCQAYTSGPNFVDINGILNRGVYLQTVNACNADGSRCQNVENCGPDGMKSGCGNYRQAPVCQYLTNQNPKNPEGSLMPKADLISTFSFAMSPPNGSGPYQLGSTSCNSGLYAGCMTAACFRKGGQTSTLSDGEEVQCECPTYNGVYQVGQKCQDCLIPGGGNQTYVWSASNTVKTGGEQ